MLAQILITLGCTSAYTPLAQAIFRTDIEVFTDEERLEGFAEHNRKKKKISDEREEHSGEIKQAREVWKKKLDDAVADYKAWKARQKEALDETSEEYVDDLRSKRRFDKELDEAQKEYVAERNRKRAQKKITIKLSEEKEYGLDENPERVEFRKRELYFADRRKKDKNKIGGGSSGASGSVDFGTPPPDFNPPLSQPPAPEFFEPDIPPPPEFDEAIPPPIFEDTPDF